MLPRHIAMAIGINLIWGFTFVAAKVGVSALPPFWFTGLRFMVIALLLVPWLRPLGPRLRPVLLVGLSMGLLHYSLLYLGIAFAGQISSVAIGTQLSVPFALLLAALVLGERIGARRWGGMALALAGLILLGFDPVVLRHLDGLALVIAAALAAACALILMRRLRGVGVLELQAWIAVISGPPLLALSWLLESGQMDASRAAGWEVWGALLFTALAASILAQGGWYFLLQRYPVAQVSTFGLLGPVFGVAFGVLIQGDQLSGRFLAGGALTLLGVAVVQLAGRSRLSR